MSDLAANEELTVRGLLGNDVMSVLDLLEVCSEEVERVGNDNVSSGLFMLLSPGDVFRGIHREVYRAHVRELLTRAEVGERLDYGTAAEVLLGLMKASLEAPLTRDGRLLYHTMFRRVMGEDTWEELHGSGLEFPREQRAGQLSELEAEAKKMVKTNRPRSVQ